MPNEKIKTGPGSRWPHRLAIIGLTAAVMIALGPLGGCYYVQAVSGQMELMRKREPIEQIMARADTPGTLVDRLRLVTDAREFAVTDLLLPDNDSYRSFADVERDYVVWNVFAAPELSLVAKTWCFPVVGCVAYRGYFAEDAAQAYAARLRREGYDVYLGGVSAYSTLGRFADPVLNTMLRWSDLDLAAVIFHELAHQRLFIKGDTGFNESFATAVAEIGLDRWVAQQGGAGELDRYRARDRLRELLMGLAATTREELNAVYGSPVADDEKRVRKAGLLAQLAQDAADVAAQHGLPESNFLRGELNNARLASLGLYHGHVAAFRAVYVACERRLVCFYERAEAIAALPSERRDAELATLAWDG